MKTTDNQKERYNFESDETENHITLMREGLLWSLCEQNYSTPLLISLLIVKKINNFRYMFIFLEGMMMKQDVPTGQWLLQNMMRFKTVSILLVVQYSTVVLEDNAYHIPHIPQMSTT